MREPLDRPNILLINCDDLGYGDTGPYGSPRNRTPVLDELARNGLKLTDFYMGASLCTPSRAALMTGCYPRRVGMATTCGGKGVLFPGDAEGLHPSEITLARLLQGQGYATMLVGKWHLGDQPEFLPLRHGFDQFFGLPYSNDMGPIRIRKEDHPPLPLMDGDEIAQEQPDQVGLTERYVERSIRFIRQHRQAPFFLYLAHMYVHVPIYVPERFKRRAINGVYGAAVEAIDWAAGAILYELRRLNLERNTLIIFTSDNGSNTQNGGSNAPLRGKKATVWEGGIRVPGLFYWPEVIPAGSSSSEPITAMDLLPTLAALAGGSPPQDRILDGHDIRPILFRPAETRSPHQAIAYYLRDDLEAIRSGPWKLFLKTGELFHLSSDIGETTPVGNAHPDQTAALRALADGFRKDLGDKATGAPGEGCRPVGRVAHPKPLTARDPEHPYIMAMYDIEGSAHGQDGL